MRHYLSLLKELSPFVYKYSSVSRTNVRTALFVSNFISFISIRNFKMMENKSIDENLSLIKCMRRLKHWIVFIAFGGPMFYFLLNLLIWVIFGRDASIQNSYIQFFFHISSHQNGLISTQIQFPFN